MANYLIPSDGQVAVPIGEVRSRQDIISVDNMYKFRIYNKKQTIAFTGFIPPDFSIDIQANWNAPYADMGLTNFIPDQGKKALTDLALQGAGLSSNMKAASAQIYSGPSYLGLSLPVLVDAYHDTKTEVVDRIIQLLSLCAPSTWHGVIVPPGPIPAAQAASEQSGIGFKDDEAFTVDIGNFFSMSPAIVTSVVSNFDNVWEDGSGNPVSVDFILNISSYFTVTREDLAIWFKQSQASTSGA